VLGKLRDQIDMRFGMLQNLRIDLLHVGGNQLQKRGQTGIFCFCCTQGNNYAHDFTPPPKHHS
jgi:hypothetical protein